MEPKLLSLLDTVFGLVSLQVVDENGIDNLISLFLKKFLNANYPTTNFVCECRRVLLHTLFFKLFCYKNTILLHM